MHFNIFVDHDFSAAVNTVILLHRIFYYRICSNLECSRINVSLCDDSSVVGQSICRDFDCTNG